ncbi:hypothetical protein FHS61_001235 [Altererythrobacter atlanticus]|uniref:Glutathione-dependent formaldehyde-activating enzyme n=1 Tax=Croceibacterium atlanticum TaxID=1267766 RepID=A0A0F7KV59_9SPHN|nr:GFA family protein [Croceibacterium atlanticum]AKH43066.1 Glutathione-dependent formaldehyde-activating enzyme [Croceibacterium atlanticum]MBB5732231.1 hypothetical protein [Croceibacterium atlanticum]
MTIPDLPWAGGCRCGKLRFRVDQAPLMTSACHCRGCQLMSGSAYSLTVSVPSGGFAITEGKAIIGGVHGQDIRHYHCEYCLSWVYTAIEPDAGFVNVRATMLDDPHWFRPYIETQTAERLPWVTVPATRSFERFPEMTEYLALAGEFQEANGLA